MSDSSRRPIREKWLDQLEIEPDNVDTEVASAVGLGVLRGSLPSMPGIIEVPLTNFERSAMAALVDAVNLVRDKCGLDKIAISSDRLHVVEAEQFKSEFGGANGFEMLGHAYLSDSRRSKPEHFAYSLSHEMAHLSSHVAVWVRLEGEGKQGQIVEVKQIRTGLQCLGQNNTPEFLGLNEAVTEYAALLFRHEVGKGLGPFAKQCAATQHTVMAYTGAFSLVLAIFRELVAQGVKPEWTDPTKVWRDALIDYWTGSDTVLDEIRRVNPSLYDDLRGLGTEHVDAVAIAVKYGLQMVTKG